MSDSSTSNGRWLSGAWPLLAVGAAVWLVYAGSLKDTGAFLYDYDARYWHRAGVCWWRGISPYDLTDFTRVWHEDFRAPPHDHGAFVYPPTLLPLSLLLGAFPWESARHIMRLVNYLCLFGIAASLWRVVPRRRGGSGLVGVADDGRTWLIACALLNAVVLTLHQGQMAIVVTLGVCLVVLGWKERSTWPVIVGVVLASMKPQITLVPLVYLAFRLSDRRMLWGIAVAGVIGCAAFLWSPPPELIADLRGSLSSHMTQGFNRLDRYDGVTGLLGGSALAKPALWTGMIVALGAALLLGRRGALGAGPGDAPTGSDWRDLQLVVVLGASLMPLHRYDLTILVVLLASLALIPGVTRRLVLFGLLVVHGQLFMLAWHARTRLGLDVGMQTLATTWASILAAVELGLVWSWWWFDRRAAPTSDCSVSALADEAA